MCPLTWHSAKDGFAECPLSQHSANNLFAFFLEMALPSAGSRALGKPDMALGKSSKTYPKRRFPDSHTAHAHTPVHRRSPACAAAACPPVPPAAIALQPASPPPVRPRRGRPSGCPPPPRLRPPAPRSLRRRSPWPAHNHPPRRFMPAAPVHAACASARHGRRMSTPSRPAAHRQSGTPPNWRSSWLSAVTASGGARNRA